MLKRVEQVKGDKIENVVKAYEVMPPEDAAARISAMDNDTALRIMTRMKSKKAGAIIAVMEPRKAAALTRRLATIVEQKKSAIIPRLRHPNRSLRYARGVCPSGRPAADAFVPQLLHN